MLGYRVRWQKRRQGRRSPRRRPPFLRHGEQKAAAVRRWMAGLSLTILCILAFEKAQSAESPSASLHGVVASEATSQRIAHAAVRLCDEGGTRLRDEITNDSGEFGFMGLNAGAYVLKVEAPGFEPMEVSTEVSFGNERGISVFLKPVRTSGRNEAIGALISAHELSLPKPVRKFLDAGKTKLYFDRDAKGALQDFRGALAKQPDCYEAYYHMGMAYLSLQNSGEAEHSLEKAVELSEENFADADLALATLRLTHHDTTRGEPLLRRALELNANSWKANYELAKLELYRNHLDQALRVAEKAKTLEPKQAMIYRLLSLIHLRQKDYPHVIEDLDAYLRLDPDSPEGSIAKKIRADTLRLMEKPQPGPGADSKPR